MSNTKAMLALFEKLTPKQKRAHFDILKLMVNKPSDVFFLVCLDGALIYQGYCINSALEANGKATSKFIQRFKQDRIQLSTAFYCVYPDGHIVDLKGD